MCANMYGNLTCYEDAWSRYVQAVFISVNTFLMIFGNIIALLIVYRSKALHDSAFCFLMNLALCDLLLGVVSQPPSLYYAITCHWPGGQDSIYCQFVGFSICLLCSVSLISLGLVSYERYSYTVHPFNHVTKFTFQRSLYVCGVVWVYCVVASLFPVVGLWKGVGLQPYNALCNIQWEVEPLYFIGMILGVLLPSGALITFSYFQIMKVARKARKIDAVRHVVTVSAVSRGDCSIQPAEESAPISTTTQTTKRHLKKLTNLKKSMRTSKCTITVALLVGTFAVCWTPYVIVSAVQALRCAPNNFWVTAFAQWMCMFNSACNPLIYGITNKTFREGLVKMFRGFRCWDRGF
ncbi:G-protein coupled receptor 161-like [Asterias rubens]|uniref:G-protein coupled receptor 161-like n=1 Tax=Asterias rubens TaxID=7604 RepID=UPI001455D958|nr:G-protein coupled receptor 161-like [Asterias rubens]